MKQIFGCIILLIGWLYVGAADAQQPGPQPKPVLAKMQPDRVHSRGYVKPANLAAMKAASFKQHGAKFKAMMAKALPATYISPFQTAQQNQGDCGNCYDVSACICHAMAQIAAGVVTNSDGTFMISADAAMNCYSVGGCGGGDAGDVWQKTSIAGTGLPSNAQYGPYVDSEGSCKSTTGMTLYKLSNYGYADGNGDGSSSYAEIKAAIYQYGAVILTNDADALGDGTQLVTDPGRGTDHQIIGIGWDDTANGGLGAIWGKNQWGQWGLATPGTLSDGTHGPGYVEIACIDSSGTMAAQCSSEVLWCEAGAGPLPPGTPPAFTSSVPISGVVGSPYAFTVTATGTPAPTFSAVSLPPGLVIDPNAGLLSGTPTTAGTFSTVFTATNTAGTATQTDAMVVLGVTPPPPPGPTDNFLVLGGVTYLIINPAKTIGVDLADAQAFAAGNSAQAALIAKYLPQPPPAPVPTPPAPDPTPPSITKAKQVFCLVIYSKDLPLTAAQKAMLVDSDFWDGLVPGRFVGYEASSSEAKPYLKYLHITPGLTLSLPAAVIFELDDEKPAEESFMASESLPADEAGVQALIGKYQQASTKSTFRRVR